MQDARRLSSEIFFTAITMQDARRPSSGIFFTAVTVQDVVLWDMKSCSFIVDVVKNIPEDSGIRSYISTFLWRG
jgi:hypothetical protein